MPCSNTCVRLFKSFRDRQRFARREILNARIRPIAFACAFASGFLATSTSATLAEPWAQSGAWMVISLSNGSGCQMGIRYPSGAILVVSAKYAPDDTPSWELLAADRRWQVIEPEKTYPISIHFPGSKEPAQQQEMLSYTSAHIKGLVARFSDFSEFYFFVSNGMATGSHIAFSFEGRLMGSFALEGASGAYDELLKCYADAASRRGS